jgi:hypothetical protein
LVALTPAMEDLVAVQVGADNQIDADNKSYSQVGW